MNSPDDKLESLFAMLRAIGKLRPYKFPVVQMAMGNTRDSVGHKSLPDGELCMSATPSQFVSTPAGSVPDSQLDFSREAEELYMQFRVNHP